MSCFNEYIERQGQMFILPVVLAVFCLYIVSGFAGCMQISYSLYGQQIDATVIKATFDENEQVYRVT